MAYRSICVSPRFLLCSNFPIAKVRRMSQSLAPFAAKFRSNFICSHCSGCIEGSRTILLDLSRPGGRCCRSRWCREVRWPGEQDFGRRVRFAKCR